MRRMWSTFALLCGAALLMLVGGGRQGRAAPPPGTTLPGLALHAYDASVGDPLVVDELTVFPIYARQNPEFEDAISLEHALAHGKAKVREVGEDDGSDASVGTLLIDNLGKVPIFVLAGTVVKGGKQDRQIGQDFVIAAHESVDVEAFCVEQGRWTQSREGKNTGGKFSASGMLAPRKVRSAAQHDSDQGKVWDEVAKTNAKANKSAGSGTLMATLDADDVKDQRRKLSKAAAKALGSAPSSDRVLGLAYAINGQVRGARWFASRQLFDQHRDKLLETAALEALLAEPQPKAAKLGAKQVRDFVDGVGRSQVTATKKRAKAVNTNLYKKSAKAGASEARVAKKKRKPTASSRTCCRTRSRSTSRISSSDAVQEDEGIVGQQHVARHDVAEHEADERAKDPVGRDVAQLAGLGGHHDDAARRGQHELDEVSLELLAGAGQSGEDVAELVFPGVVSVAGH